MANFNPAAVRFGRPGVLYVATVGTSEPDDVHSAPGTGWYPMGYTDTGSQFSYSITIENVEVAEELDVFARVTTGRDASVEFALAEITKRNLHMVFNGGIVLGDGTAWEFDPPEMGYETRIAIMWDALNSYGATPSATTNDLRFIFRQCLQTGSLAIENRKGTTKQTLSATFGLEKPVVGSGDETKVLRILGAGVLNPDETP